MSKASTLAQLNARFECPACSMRGVWQFMARPQVRINSTILKLRCTSCDARVVAKAMPLKPVHAGGHQVGQREYEILRMLQSVFPQSEHYATLVPLGYLEFDASSVLLTRAFAGRSMALQARTLDVDGLRRMCRSAGGLLRILHDCSPAAGKDLGLDTEARISALLQDYGKHLIGNPVIRSAFGTLRRHAERVAAMPVRCAWSHGDFKPGNVLYDGNQSVVFDTQLEFRSPVVYDLASFLDHLQLVKHRCNVRDLSTLEQAFLAGYGDLDALEIAAIRWAQLYFMLRYWAREQERGILGSLRARATMQPSIKILIEQCEEPRARRHP